MHKIIILILTVCFLGCKNKPKENLRYTDKQIALLELDSTKILNVISDSITRIDLNPFLQEQNFDFGSLVKDVSLVPLETTNKSLLDGIIKVVTTESNIYVYDRFKDGGLVIFTRKGKFVKRIPNGKGPGELMRLYDIDFDKQNNELIAYQHSFLLFYTPSGEFIRQQRLPFGFYNFTAIPSGYIFKTLDGQGNEHLGSIKDFTLLVSDKMFQLKSVGLHCSKITINLGGYNYIFNNGTLHVTQRFSDTIYQYTNVTNRLKAIYFLDYGTKKLPEKYLKESKQTFKEVTIQNDYYFYLGQYIDTKQNNIFFLENRHIGTQTIVFRDKITGNLIGGTSADYNNNEIPPIAFPKTASGDYLISWYYPSKSDISSIKGSMISDEDKLNIKDLTEDDNPVLVFYRLKNF